MQTFSALAPTTPPPHIINNTCLRICGENIFTAIFSLPPCASLDLSSAPLIRILIQFCGEAGYHAATNVVDTPQ
jgi:hypothetical protein